MRIIAKRTLREFWEQPEYSDAQSALEAWHFEALKSSWKIPQDIKDKYRLIVSVDYERQACFIKFVGTHKQYDDIDVEVYDGYSTN